MKYILTRHAIKRLERLKNNKINIYEDIRKAREKKRVGDRRHLIGKHALYIISDDGYIITIIKKDAYRKKSKQHKRIPPKHSKKF